MRCTQHDLLEITVSLEAHLPIDQSCSLAFCATAQQAVHNPHRSSLSSAPASELERAEASLASPTSIIEVTATDEIRKSAYFTPSASLPSCCVLLQGADSTAYQIADALGLTLLLFTIAACSRKLCVLRHSIRQLQGVWRGCRQQAKVPCRCWQTKFMIRKNSSHYCISACTASVLLIAFPSRVLDLSGWGAGSLMILYLGSMDLCFEGSEQ